MRHYDVQYIAGLKEQPPGYSFITAEYDHFQVVFIHVGELYFQTNTHQQRLSAGDVLLLRLGSGFRLNCREQGYRGVCFNAFGDVDDVFTGEAFACVAVPSVCEIAGFMLREINAPAEGSSAVLEGLGLALAWHAVRQTTFGAERGDAHYWAECTRQAILTTLSTGRGVAEALATLPLSYRQLTRHFIAHTGLSPKQYQQQVRLAEVKRLLRETKLPVTTIAYEVGYPSSQHLTTQFRCLTGLTPASFRALSEP